MMTVTKMKKQKNLKTRVGMFKNMGGNIPGGNFLGGNFPGGTFPDTVNLFTLKRFKVCVFVNLDTFETLSLAFA